jgi:hypothetical protein
MRWRRDKVPPVDPWDWDAKPGRGRGGLLLWCAGVDRTVLRTRAEAIRYGTMGALMLAVAALAATTFTIFASVVIGRFHWYLPVFGVGWGLLILMVDRSIVTETHYRERAALAALAAKGSSAPASSLNGVNGTGNGTSNGSANGHPNGHGDADAVGVAGPGDAAGPNRTLPLTPVSGPGQAAGDDPLGTMKPPSDRSGWPNRALVYALRIAMALCIAFLVSEAAILLIFHDEVEQTLQKTHAAQYQQAVNQAVATATAKQTVVVNNAAQTVAGDNTQVQEDEQTSEKWTQQAAAEEGGDKSGPEGIASGQAGDGESEKADRAEATLFTDKAQKELTKEEQDEATYSKQENLLTDARQDDPAALQALGVQDPAQQHARIFGDNGFYAQDVAFNTFVSQNGDNFTLKSMPWVLRFLLISIDLIPLTTKLLNRYTIYGRRLSERALLIRYSDLLRNQEAIRDIEHRRDIARINRSHDLDMREKHVEHDRYWQTVHMERDR